MRRSAVIGNGGGGRSALAPLDEVAHTRESWAAEDSWIIDGFGPCPVTDQRMGRADTIVYVDLPFRTHLWWATKRQIASVIRRRAWAGQSAPPPTVLLFRTLRRVHSVRSDLLEPVTKNGRAARLVHLRSRRELARSIAEITRTTVGVAD